MTAQRKAPRRRTSSKDQEFERLLRRAALYAKTHPKWQMAPARVVSITRRKRVKAA
jgi:hypothetical protein